MAKDSPRFASDDCRSFLYSRSLGALRPQRHCVGQRSPSTDLSGDSVGRLAIPRRRHPEGADGDWFIDDGCIGCGASTSIAPWLIRAANDGRQSVFVRQPDSQEDVVLAQQAAEVCPTRSIGTESRQRWRKHHPVEVTSGVWRTGSNSPETAGGNAFIVRRSSGGLLIDAPRFTPSVRSDITQRGGIRTILLTHRDDVGDAEQYADVFGAEVVIHEADHDAAPSATRVRTGLDPVARRRSRRHPDTWSHRRPCDVPRGRRDAVHRRFARLGSTPRRPVGGEVRVLVVVARAARLARAARVAPLRTGRPHPRSDQSHPRCRGHARPTASSGPASLRETQTD